MRKQSISWFDLDVLSGDALWLMKFLDENAIDYDKGISSYPGYTSFDIYLLDENYKSDFLSVLNARGVKFKLGKNIKGGFSMRRKKAQNLSYEEYQYFEVAGGALGQELRRVLEQSNYLDVAFEESGIYDDPDFFSKEQEAKQVFVGQIMEEIRNELLVAWKKESKKYRR